MLGFSLQKKKILENPLQQESHLNKIFVIACSAQTGQLIVLPYQVLDL